MALNETHFQFAERGPVSVYKFRFDGDEQFFVRAVIGCAVAKRLTDRCTTRVGGGCKSEKSERNKTSPGCSRREWKPEGLQPEEADKPLHICLSYCHEE